mmetsp:Transcript_19559/g.60303  ORF Transcript_19559/g.60303 Transcript_19559/m.60303 type:complete len:240 (+) Transcript_19559:304-1023(+)
MVELVGPRGRRREDGSVKGLVAHVAQRCAPHGKRQFGVVGHQVRVTGVRLPHEARRGREVRVVRKAAARPAGVAAAHVDRDAGFLRRRPAISTVEESPRAPRVPRERAAVRLRFWSPGAYWRQVAVDESVARFRPIRRKPAALGQVREQIPSREIADLADDGRSEAVAPAFAVRDGAWRPARVRVVRSFNRRNAATLDRRGAAMSTLRGNDPDRAGAEQEQVAAAAHRMAVASRHSASA